MPALANHSNSNVTYSNNTLTLNGSNTNVTGNLLINGYIASQNIFKEDINYISRIIVQGYNTNEFCYIEKRDLIDEIKREMAITSHAPAVDNHQPKPLLIFYYPKGYDNESIKKYYSEVTKSNIIHDYHTLFVLDSSTGTPWVDIITVDSLSEIELEDLKKEIKDKLKN